MKKVGDSRSPESNLGGHLARLRTASGLSLRQVEEATDKEVSNAYLSQLENDKITKPSPNILHALASVYKTSYEDLMVRAGYIGASVADGGRRQGKVATFAIGDLSKEEEDALIEYLAFIRKTRKK
jgi:transcriptional regulator with XRE-family HTH domain